jgi:hypothetical protein
MLSISLLIIAIVILEAKDSQDFRQPINNLLSKNQLILQQCSPYIQSRLILIYTLGLDTLFLENCGEGM